MLTVQFAAAARVAGDIGQVFVWAKSPVATMPVIVNGPVPGFVSVTACVALVDPTAWLVNVKLAGATLAAGTVPVPLRLIVCGLPGSLSVIVTVPVTLPDALGVNVILTVQLAPDAKVAGGTGQVLVWAKVPVTAIPDTVNGPVPVLESVTVWAALVNPTFRLVKVKLVGATLAAGTVPVPLMLIVCGLPAASSVIDTAALRAPVAVGAKVTLMVQFPPAATVAPQVPVWAKSPVLAPVIAILAMLRVAPPLLVSVITWAAVLLPTF
jgi:hypothetical protein